MPGSEDIPGIAIHVQNRTHPLPLAFPLAYLIIKLLNIIKLYQ